MDRTAFATSTVTDAPSPRSRRHDGGPAKAKRAAFVWDVLIWAFRDQKVARVSSIESRRGLFAHGFEQTHVVCRHLQRGTFIDGEGPWGGSLAVHQDAELVWDAVRLVVPGGALWDFVGWCETATPPSCDVDYVPLYTRKVERKPGKPAIIYDDNRHAVACELEIGGDALEMVEQRVRAARTRYGLFIAWLDGIRELLTSEKQFGGAGHTMASGNWRLEISTGHLSSVTLGGLGLPRDPWRHAGQACEPKVTPLVDDPLDFAKIV
jgi:hypothetical protein